MLKKEVKIVRNTHILLAQKPDLNRILISSYLTQAGYHVYEIRYARDILMQLQSVQTDAILLDLNFPDLDAYKKNINRIARNKNIPIFFICNSKEIDFTDALEGFKLADHELDDSTADGHAIDWNADNFIMQPIKRAQLLVIINTHLQKAQSNKKSNPNAISEADLFQHTPIAIAYTDHFFNLYKSNSQFFNQFGYKEDLKKLTQIFNFSATLNPQNEEQLLTHVLLDGQVDFEIETRHKNGNVTWCSVRCRLLTQNNPDTGLIWTLDDITERKQEQQQVKQAATVFEGSGDSMIIIDTSGLIERINPALKHLTGFNADDIQGLSLSELFDETQNTHSILYVLSLVTHQNQWSGELWLRKKNGAKFPAKVIINCITRPDLSICHFVAVLSDISEDIAQVRELKHRANHDPLTGLPNRNEFFIRLNEAIANAKRQQYCIALLYLDLDGFKPINDTLGHGKGDEVLQQVARKLQQCIRNVDTVARLGGDEFSIILNGTSEGLVTETASRLIKSLTMSFGNTLQLSVSIGIAVFPNDSINPHKLLQYADKAMYKAKLKGKQSYCWHNVRL